MRLNKAVNRIFARVDRQDLAGANRAFQQALDEAHSGRLEKRIPSPWIAVLATVIMGVAGLVLIWSGCIHA
jgi:hypothetical protein